MIDPQQFEPIFFGSSARLKVLELARLFLVELPSLNCTWLECCAYLHFNCVPVLHNSRSNVYGGPGQVGSRKSNKLVDDISNFID